MRAARDRGRARVIAFILSLPVFAIAVAICFFVVQAMVIERPTALSVAVVILPGFVFAFFLVVLSQWTFAFISAIAMPQRIQAIWLRRFQAEGGPAFRVSRVVDRSSRYGISMLTMQDRDVRLSWEQRRNRLAPVFWLTFAPIAVAIGLYFSSLWLQTQREIAEKTTNATLGEAIGVALAGALALGGIIALAVAVTFVVIAAVMLLASLVGPVGAFGTRHRDDFRKLPRLLRRMAQGKRRRGTVVVRITDDHWKKAVSLALRVVDVAIIDLSTVTAAISWEIDEALAACGPAGLVFISRAGPGGEHALSSQAVAALAAAGRDPVEVVFYPTMRGAGRRAEEQFARELRQATYAATARRHSQV